MPGYGPRAGSRPSVKRELTSLAAGEKRGRLSRVSEAAPAKTPDKPRHGLPGGLTGNALLTAVIAAIVSGAIAFGIASWQARDAASQAHAVQVADGAAQVETAAQGYYNAAQSLYAARRQCIRQTHQGGEVPPGCPASDTAFLTAQAVLSAAYANTSDVKAHRLLAAFDMDVHNDLEQLAGGIAGFPTRMTDAYYALVARCGQLIQGR